MAVPLLSVVSVNISVADISVGADSFDTILVATSDQSISPARVKEYVGPGSSILAAMVADGMESDTGAYRTVAAMMKPDRHVQRVKIGRRDGTPIQKFNLIPTSSVDGVVYSILVNDEVATYTVSSDTVAQIITALASAVTALTAAVTPTDNTTSLDITATAGAELNIRFEGPFTIDDTTVADDVDDDLDLFVATESAFYGFVIAAVTDAEAVQAAAWAETNHKRFNFVSQSTAHLAGTGIGQDLVEDGVNYTKMIQVADPGDAHDAAIMSKEFSYNPGVYTLDKQTLASMSVSNYASGQITALAADNVSYFESFGGVNLFFGSKAPSGRAMDTVRFVDFLTNAIQVAIANVLINATNTVGKVPYTDKGIGMIAGAIRQVLQQQVLRGALVGKEGTEAQQPKVSFPSAASISTEDKVARHLPDGFFSCTYTGAIETVTIEGIISL